MYVFFKHLVKKKKHRQTKVYCYDYTHDISVHNKFSQTPRFDITNRNMSFSSSSIFKKDIISDYSDIKIINVGKNSTICLSVNKRTNTKVILKVFAHRSICHREVMTLFKLGKSIFLVDMMNYDTTHHTRWWYSMPVYSCDAFNYVKKKGFITFESALKVGACISQALDLIHSNNLVYVDLKLENIFVDDSGIPKLGDMGGVIASNEHVIEYTPSTASPETLIRKVAYPKSDAWSLGILIMELCQNVKVKVNKLKEMKESCYKLNTALLIDAVSFDPKDYGIVNELIVFDIVKRLPMRSNTRPLHNLFNVIDTFDMFT